ncbi:MAG TPA: ABC transporter ATP-binding protein [Chthonomonadales bacterium]|nr:ABC transporter ATP-binding protein [Chthonomonadales bacterium]
MASGIAAIACEGLTKEFGAFRAVDNLDLRIEPGELFGFLGPNGAGKTTTIKMMVGLLRPTAGSVRIAGIDMLRQPLDAKRVVGYIPDEPYLYEKLTGREFLNFMADLYSVSPRGRAEEIERLLAMFELTEKGDELIQGYSRGMRRKIALSGALIHRPQVVFLDEPTLGLDPRSARLMKEILRQLCLSGATVFLSTHILEVAERMCDRFAIINRGKVIALGTMAELRERGGSANGTLEDIFLELTSSEEDRDVIRSLGV